MITLQELEEGCRKYKEYEGREGFYDIALEITDDHPLQASIVILATWNSSRFRPTMSNPQNIRNLKDAIEKCKPLFDSIKDKEIQTVNLDEIKDTIKDIYSMLSKVQGIEYTGGSKVMHLINRKLFVMWDSFIRKGYDIKTTEAEDYFNFLKMIQNEIKDIEWDNTQKTLTKAVDEYNYVRFSL
jgi:hypothetical protein